jgi:hypothetical protein
MANFAAFAMLSMVDWGRRARAGAGERMADSEGAVAPAEPADETPPAATWRIGRFAVASGLVISAAIHLLLIGPAVILASRLLQFEPAQSMTVDLVTAQELAAMSEKMPDKPAQPDKPSQPPRATPAQPQPPVSQAPSPVNPFATPLLPPPPPAPALQAPLLTTLAGLASSIEKDGGASDYQANLTEDDIRAFATHVQGCWAAPPGLAQDVYVIVRVSLRRDGSLMTEPTLQGGSASKAAMALAVADSAKRALRNCTPYGGLPVAKYDEWRLLDLRFTPSGIATASTVSNDRPG